MAQCIHITGRVDRVEFGCTRQGKRVIHCRVYDPAPPGCWRSIVFSGELAEAHGSRIATGVRLRVSGSLHSRRSNRGEFLKAEEVEVIDSPTQLELFPSATGVAV